MKGWPRLILLGFVALALTGDSCFGSLRLYSATAFERAGFSQLYQAASHGNKNAAAALSKRAIMAMDSHWIAMSAELGIVQSLVFLAQQSQDSTQQLHYLKMAANQGHTASQYQLAEQLSGTAKRIELLKQSANSQYPPAAAALYHYFSDNADHQAAKRWLPLAAKQDRELAIVYAFSLWESRQWQQAIETLEQAHLMGSQRAKRLMDLLNQYWHRDGTLAIQPLNKRKCASTLQFFATSLVSLEQIDGVISQFRQDQRMTSLPICILHPVLLDSQEIQCSQGDAPRLSCNLQPVIAQAQQSDFTHAVVVAEKGKANVHNGIMYLDLDDTYQVFVHELAHFVGFVDEYPLDQQLAQSHCAKKSAPNLLIGSSIDDVDIQQWAYLNQAGVLLSPSRTCDNTSQKAFKPVKDITFLEYHDVENIPKVYLEIWRHQLARPASMTPVYVNFAQYFEAKGDKEQARQWWSKYHQFIATDN